MGRQVKGTAGSQTTPAGNCKNSLNGFIGQPIFQLAQAIPNCVRLKVLSAFSEILMAGAGECLLEGYITSLI